MSLRLKAVIAFCVASIFALAVAPLLSLHAHAHAHAQARPAAAANNGPVGMFEAHNDVGKLLHQGTTEYDATAKTYTITGSGNNMWMTEDDFQFAWKKMSGDVSVTADISFYGVGGNAHRKGVLMIRQSLDADSVYEIGRAHV